MVHYDNCCLHVSFLIFQFFNTVRYIIGGHEYSLQDIENGVLRSNRKGVGKYGPWVIWMQFSTLFYWLVSLDLLMVMPSDECHGTFLIISQYWFK